MMFQFFECFLKFATFNIRFSPPGPTGQLFTNHGGTGEAPWPARLPLILDQVQWESPDIIGFQEVLEHQYEDLKRGLDPNIYSSVGVGRDDGATLGEYVPLFWRTDRFKALSVEFFWLSDEPQIPGSIGWDAAQTRMVTLVHFEPHSTSMDSGGRSIDSGRIDVLAQTPGESQKPLVFSEDLPLQCVDDSTFYVMNTHFDDQGQKARTESARLILKKARSLVAKTCRPVVLLGDLNAPASEPAYSVLTGIVPTADTASSAHGPFFQDAATQVNRPYGTYNATFTGFAGRPADRGVIDFVMIMSGRTLWKAKRYGVIPNSFDNGPLASDHRLVCATLDPGFRDIDPTALNIRGFRAENSVTMVEVQALPTVLTYSSSSAWTVSDNSVTP